MGDRIDIARWPARVRAAIDRLYSPIPPATDDDLRAWEIQRKEDDFKNWRFALILSFLFTTLWWWTDFVIIPRSATAHLAAARAFAALMTLGLVLAARFVPFVHRHAIPIFGAGGLAVCVFAGVHFGYLGGPDQPWFHFGHFAVLPPIAITMRPWTRLAVTFTFGTAFGLGFFAFHPEHIGAPLTGAGLNYLAFAIVAAHVAGLAVQHMRLRAFVLLRTSERQAEELRVLKADLERRVAERTREVRTLLAHFESAREAERGRLARELHDELGQELTAIRYAVELARRRHAADPLSITANLAEIESLLQRARLATREVVTELRPHVLDHLGLPAAAELLARRTAERTGLAVRYSVEVPDDGAAPSAEVATAGYRILQECLTNAARHAGAHAVDVALRGEGAALVVAVGDDGCGFDPSALTPGFGLLGMRERASALGIELAIASAPGAGTRVTARLPLARGAPASEEVASASAVG